MKIVEEILTLRCPRCSQAFLDFDGCFALTCCACDCGFCGWCLEDCGSDAHRHVANCPAKLGSDALFGTKEQFRKAQQKRKEERLVAFLGSLPTNEQRLAALDGVKSDLDDLGIVIDRNRLLSL
eukprot:CAMPEP_0118677548 /NCGR_PEP_ID=MMETSP0800-20121206/2690_1 /TAXON_ID=210618 ORGANISM="Striatella unipunctata, Strain CCMP2910" /NCGR_SAMPLE_ID=MMETSP0800 /ASSEMBLY_ACC=CAM_ASM_000638 /LENGTH=123 /DNA_ID=CAMNT_0006573237 /DNA_START=292 /DNA_END=663 /DNA_ORIENTATION=+